MIDSKMNSLEDHGELGSLLGFLQLLLGLPELGQVEGGDLLGLLDLLLVGLDPVLVLLVLLNLEGKLLGATLRLLVSLGVLSSVSLNISELNLEHTDASLELGHGSATT